MQNVLPKAVLIIFMSLTIYMISIATYWGLADVYYLPAMNQLKNWRLGKVELENKDWESLRISLSKALELDPDNPEIHEQLGLAIESRFSTMPSMDPEAEVFRELALEHYRTSVLLRPTWPYGWSKLAAVKYRLGQIDDEFYQAFHNAERLGPWEPIIQRNLIEIGLLNWSIFSESERAFLLGMITHGLETQADALLNIVDNYGLLEIICLLNNKNSRVNDYCEKHQEK